MTLVIHHELIQGTDEWLNARCGIITASTIGKLITPKTVKPAANPASRDLTMLLAAERITRRVEPNTYLSAAMLRGIEDEPRARDYYASLITEPVTEVGFITEDKFGYTIGYSPDGLVGDDGLIEIKSREPKTQIRTVVEDAVPEENMAQCQTGLLVTGRKWLDYISWCGGEPIYIKRVFPDEKWFNTIQETVARFERNVTDIAMRYEANTYGRPKTEHIEAPTEIRFAS